jgi:hypothetical protein
VTLVRISTLIAKLAGGRMGWNFAGGWETFNQKVDRIASIMFEHFRRRNIHSLPAAMLRKRADAAYHHPRQAARRWRYALPIS